MTRRGLRLDVFPRLGLGGRDEGCSLIESLCESAQRSTRHGHRVDQDFAGVYELRLKLRRFGRCGHFVGHAARTREQTSCEGGPTLDAPGIRFARISSESALKLGNAIPYDLSEGHVAVHILHEA